MRPYGYIYICRYRYGCICRPVLGARSAVAVTRAAEVQVCVLSSPHDFL